MKKEKKQTGHKSAPSRNEQPSHPHWPYMLGVFLLLFLLFEVYQPALSGPFVFDDTYLPMMLPDFASLPFEAWIKGVRPMLMASYWANTRAFGLDPYYFHLINIFIHIAAGGCVWLWARKLIQQVNKDQWLVEVLSAFTAVIFLFHPLQTESVAYIAGRSESFSGLLFLAAFVIFLYRRNKAIGWVETVLVLLFFGLATRTKEHTAVLPVLMLLTDYYFNPGFSMEGIKKNWLVYLPIVAGGGVGVYVALRLVSGADSAGFGIKEFTWYQYLFTQFRSICVYAGMFILPVGQNIDHDQGISFTIFDHGAVIAGAFLLGAVVAAWIWRKKYPLASYGLLVFLLLLAPTSSIIPIRDTLIERRMYLPLIGLCFVAAQFLPMIRISRTALVAALSIASVATAYASYLRNSVWSDSISLWRDSVEKGPTKARPRFQLAFALYSAGKCSEATGHYAKASQLEKPDYRLYIDWALAEDCASRFDEALEKLRLAEAIENNAHVHTTIAMVLAKQSKFEMAHLELDIAEQRDSRFPVTPVYRGNIYLQTKEFDKAIEAFNIAIQRDSKNQSARQSLAMAQQQKALAAAGRK